MKVAVVYHLLAHYRMAVMTALDHQPDLSVEFYAAYQESEGVISLDASALKRFVPSPGHWFGPLFWQTNAVRVALKRDRPDAIIYLANPWFVSTWIGAMAARLRGIPVLFWGHGWLRPETGGKRLLRAVYFRLANRMMLYSQRAAGLGRDTGYPADRITVIFNSLNTDAADEVVADIEAGRLNTHDPHSFFEDKARPLVICTARLIRACRFDLLLQAADLLAKRGQPVNILLVGDGPERAGLVAQARELGLAVHFMGACYDESILGQLIYGADVTVSPGKIGLTAMHSLMYGTPAITHDNLDEQMPEVEALFPERVGALFRQGDATDLADVLHQWLNNGLDRQEVRARCRAEIARHWTPQIQVARIKEALSKVRAGG